MKPLHSSYHNLGSWKCIREPGNFKLHIVYNPKPSIIGALVVFVLCAMFIFFLWHLLEPKSGKSLAIGIIATTGILVPSIMIAYAFIQANKKPLLTYSPTENLLIVREPALEIHEAKQRVSFSSEHFKEHSDHYFEFNIVIDGERKKFLSSISNSFKRLTRDLNGMGFHVAKHSINL